MYIHLNPVRAGLASVAEEYRWSSVRLYFEEDAPESFVDPHFILNIVSGKEDNGRQIYRDLLNRGVKVETKQVFEQEDVIERFRSRLASLFPSIFKRIAGGNHTGKAAGMNLLSMEAVEERIEKLKDASFTNGPETRLAKKYLIEQLIARGYKRTEIAERLRVSRKTVYNILNAPV